MGALADELRKKYRNPSEALAALGLDAAILKGVSNQKENSMSKKVLSRFAGASAVALGMYLRPRLAQDAKLDLTPLLADVTKKNFGAKKAKLAADIKVAAGKLGLAKDANLDDVHDFMDRLDKEDVAEGADEDPNSGLPMNAEELKKKAKDEAEAEEKEEKEKKAADRKAARDAFLKEKGMDEADIEAMDALCNEDAESEEAEESAEGKEGAGEKKGAKDKAARDKAAKDKKGMDKSAMDAALKIHGDKIKRDMRETAQAYVDVEPYVGKLSLGMDSAAEVYRTALKGLGMDAKAVDVMHVDALKPVLQAQRKAGEKAITIANDAALGDTSGFTSRWGDIAGRIEA